MFRILKVREFVRGLVTQELYCLSDEDFNRWRMGLISKLKFLKPNTSNELAKLEFFQCLLACYTVLKPPKKDEVVISLSS